MWDDDAGRFEGVLGRRWRLCPEGEGESTGLREGVASRNLSGWKMLGGLLFHEDAMLRIPEVGLLQSRRGDDIGEGDEELRLRVGWWSVEFSSALLADWISSKQGDFHCQRLPVFKSTIHIFLSLIFAPHLLQ